MSVVPFPKLERGRVVEIVAWLMRERRDGEDVFQAFERIVMGQAFAEFENLAEVGRVLGHDGNENARAQWSFRRMRRNGLSTVHKRRKWA